MPNFIRKKHREKKSFFKVGPRKVFYTPFYWKFCADSKTGQNFDLGPKLSELRPF